VYRKFDRGEVVVEGGPLNSELKNDFGLDYGETVRVFAYRNAQQANRNGFNQGSRGSYGNYGKNYGTYGNTHGNYGNTHGNYGNAHGNYGNTTHGNYGNTHGNHGNIPPNYSRDNNRGGPHRKRGYEENHENEYLQDPGKNISNLEISTSSAYNGNYMQSSHGKDSYHKDPYHAREGNHHNNHGYNNHYENYDDYSRSLVTEVLGGSPVYNCVPPVSPAEGRNENGQQAHNNYSMGYRYGLSNSGYSNGYGVQSTPKFFLEKAIRVEILILKFKFR
jgi:hypothetical protein